MRTIKSVMPGSTVVEVNEDFTVTAVPEGIIFKKGQQGVLQEGAGYYINFAGTGLLPAARVYFSDFHYIVSVPLHLLEVVG